jgi:hypothetical protein
MRHWSHLQGLQKSARNLFIFSHHESHTPA